MLIGPLSPRTHRTSTSPLLSSRSKASPHFEVCSLTREGILGAGDKMAAGSDSLLTLSSTCALTLPQQLSRGSSRKRSSGSSTSRWVSLRTLSLSVSPINAPQPITESPTVTRHSDPLSSLLPLAALTDNNTTLHYLMFASKSLALTLPHARPAKTSAHLSLRLNLASAFNKHSALSGIQVAESIIGSVGPPCSSDSLANRTADVFPSSS
jgi:hypothetical protein